MADIQKCAKPCDIKEACYRFTAPDSTHQAYGEPEWRDGECLDFYPRREAPGRGLSPDPSQGNTQGT